jgi:hypothetical protein
MVTREVLNYPPRPHYLNRRLREDKSFGLAWLTYQAKNVAANAMYERNRDTIDYRYAGIVTPGVPCFLRDGE